ncbi:MAG: insulinase family protein [Oscillospiraceae bacterium]|jgi:predicted Zn-dependent peptidase|nr:insulinase family protein [Oscillospiraceae bacterium]
MSAIDWETCRDAALEEAYYRTKLPGGLELQVLPKLGYSTAYALFSTKYGSIDTAIVYPDGSEFTLPEGTAHFLEHKLFESEDLDAFARFAKTGASANAFTGFNKTAYEFSCSEHFAENLEILLDFVQSPYFTQATVEKEQGIIGQEIRMYLDVPSWRIFFELLRLLYSTHPVRIEIAGTEESIAEISAEMLHECYRRFYHPANMILAVAGNVTKEEVGEIAARLLKPAQGAPAQRRKMVDDAPPAQALTRLQMPVAAPRFLLGWKEPTAGEEPCERAYLLAELCLEALAGETSPLYERLLNEGMINPGFGWEFLSGPGYAASLLGGESKKPEEAAEIIRQALADAVQNGLDPAAFEQARRKAYGRQVMLCNDIDTLAGNLTDAYFSGETIFEKAALLRTLTPADANERLKHLFRPGFAALAIVEPTK